MVKKKSQQNEPSFLAAKEQYDSFRRKQESMNNKFGKVNNILTSMKKVDMKMSATQMPSYDKSILERLKDDINNTVRNKKGF